MIVKQLNGDLFEIEFDTPHQTVLDICKRIWDFQKTEKKDENEEKKYFNHFVFENEGEQITIDSFHPFFDFNKKELFVNKGFNIKNGLDRIIDTSVFSSCNAFFFPKKPKILVYCTGKNKFRCIDVNDFSFHVDASLVMVNDPFGYRLAGSDGKNVENRQIELIDYSSFLSHYPNSFKSGSRVFEDTNTKIECYLTKIIRGLQPGYMARDGSNRRNSNHRQIIEYC